MSPLCAAGMRSGKAGASARKIVSRTVGKDKLQPPMGAGRRALSNFPGGSMTLSARNEPSFTSRWGSVSALKATRAAGCNLRAEISQRRLRESNIVLDQTQHLGIWLAVGVNLHGANLQPLFIDIARHAGAKPGAPPADVDPVRPHRQKT